MKKIFSVGTAILVAAQMGGITAMAQVPSVGSAVAGSAAAAPGTVTTGVNVLPGDELLQLNNLVVQSASQTEITATFPYATPMMLNAGGAANAPSAAAPSAAGQCVQFQSETDNAGISVACPTPPGTTNAAPDSSATSPSALPAAPSGSAAPTVIARPVPPMPIETPYRIEITTDTRLMLRDRSVAAISDFAPGDRINVFGFYNSDGTVRGLIVRNLSKPAETAFIQLNNVNLISVSGTAGAATLTVAQKTIYPCYSYGASGANSPVNYPCPLGLESSAASSAAVPRALMPIWQSARKYQVEIDSRTILLDRTRGAISLSDLRAGDTLNVYGEMTGDNAPVNADIVRDLDLPATPQVYSGTITQTNADGSFVIQLQDGTSVTVSNSLSVGTNIQIKGVLDRVQNVLSQVLQIMIGNQNVPQPVPLPVPVPMMLRSQGASQAAPSTVPNGQ